MNNFLQNLIDKIDYLRELDYAGQDYCDIDNIMLLELCGGMPIKDVAYIHLEVVVTGSCVYDVRVTTNHFYLDRTINFQTKHINNNQLNVATPRNGIGTNILYNQIIAARKFNFFELRLNAARASNMNGYYTWGRLGFTMRTLDLKRLEKWCFEKEIKSQNIFEILKNEKDNNEWKNSGFGWSGLFDLSENSENIKLFCQYLETKGLGKFGQSFF